MEHVRFAGLSPSPGAVRASCRWVPGTLDRVELTLEGLEPRVVDSAWLRAAAGTAVLERLYLSGRAEFDCDPASFGSGLHLSRDALEAYPSRFAPGAAEGARELPR